MSRRIKQWIELFFDGIPYSEEAEKAREVIRTALEKQAADATPDELAAHYGSYESLALLGGYTEEDARAWRSTAASEDADSVKKSFRAQRWHVYLISALFSALFAELLWTIYDIAARRSEGFFAVALSTLFAVTALLQMRRLKAVEKQHSRERCDAAAYVFLRSKSNQYTKRLLNSIALLFGALAIFSGGELSFYLLGNSKPEELVENAFSNLFLIQIPLYLFLKNTLLVKILQNRIGLPERRRFLRHVKGMVAFSFLYWVVVIAATLLLRESINYPANVFLLAGGAFFLLVLEYNLTLRRRITYRNVVFNPQRVTIVALVAILVGSFIMMRRETYYTQPYINALPVVGSNDNPIVYDEVTGVYTITAARDHFKILHLTDIHLGGSLFSFRQDKKAFAACYALITHTRPDLVIVTGDMSFPLGMMSLSFNNSAPVYQFASFMRNLNIPWAFTYGNHDTESLASMNREDLDSVYRSLSFKTSGILLYPYVQPQITGRNNQLIELRNADGTLNTALFLIDSNAYTGEGLNAYDYIHDDQVEWYAGEIERLSKEAGRTVPSMLFFHIPLQQYRTAYELYESGSNEVTYFFGENQEKMINKVCCSDYPSTLFDRARALGATAMFCGHDHYNNMSLEYQGIRLTYGMSIDYLAMPGIENDTAQRGGELITIHRDGTWELRQVPLTSITS